MAVARVRDRTAPSQPAHKETREVNDAPPGLIGAAIRLSLAAAPAVLGVQHDAARTPTPAAPAVRHTTSELVRVLVPRSLFNSLTI